jgi:DNA modification methylase
MELKQVDVDSLIAYPENARTHNDKQVAQIAESIKEFGFCAPCLVDEKGVLIAGHGRVMAAQTLGLKTIPTISIEHLTPEQVKAYRLADNQLALNAGWDLELLGLEVSELKSDGFDIDLLGFDEQLILGGKYDYGAVGESKGNLSEKFGIPPFSVLNTREGWWQDRRRAWVALGIESELGRGDNLIGLDPFASAINKGTSLFDPVLAEIAYRWFCPPKGDVLDPFAGGTVRGIVASKLGRRYVGVDLREEQVKANRIQATNICMTEVPTWHCGDSKDIKDLASGDYDFIFSCPPYADLEVYSDNAADLSTMEYETFRKTYYDIIKSSCSLLKNDRFACFVVGEVRNKKGGYYNFVGDTVKAFQEAGLSYYNEAILVTAVGTLPLRAGKTFEASRKLGKTHQNVLIFVKGDAAKATKLIGPCEFGDMDAQAN